MNDAPHPLSPQDSLVAVMIGISASDTNMRTAELLQIQSIINHLPVFAGYDPDRISEVSQIVFELLSVDEGLDAFFGLIRENLPEELYETAYALGCDVAASDGRTGQPELRLLQEIRYELNLDPLHAAAIEVGARARFTTYES